MRRIFLLVAVAACGPGHHSGGDDAGNGDDAGSTIDAFTGPFDDFPTTPISDGSAPGNAGGLFGDPGTGDPSGGPCIVEPEVGTLYPDNWLRPRFTWVATGGENLFELRLTAANETNPLIVYTTATQWTMPATMWQLLSAHIIDAPITMTIRGAVWDGNVLTAGPSLGSTGDVTIAPVAAPGAIVYWTTTGGTLLRGFHVGDETVSDIVSPTQASTACVGCHASTPDGKYVGFSASPNPGNGDPATFGLRSVDGNATAAPFVSASAGTLMSRQNQELPVFSKRHWQTGDRVGLTMYPINNRFEITWTDLEATSTDSGNGWGVLARNNDGSNGAAYASFAHGSDTVLYVSSPDVAAGVTVAHGDLATIPYANRAGGDRTLVPGASDGAYNEYYPTYSPDDEFIAFNRVTDGLSSYNNSAAEVFVIPAAGGTPTRLAANDPPSCGGQASPGITNSWPKWAPEVGHHGNRDYYWLTFSSTRGAGNPQLYVTPIVVEGGTITTYPALYLWNQPPTENNHTPAWDVFDIPVP